MEKYYLMAVEKGHPQSMYNLGKYYEFIIKNEELMLKYYEMAFKQFSDKSNEIDYIKIDKHKYYVHL